MEELYILFRRGGSYEDSWSSEQAVVGKANADKAFDQAVATADANDTDMITLESAYIAEDGVIRATDGFLREWYQWEWGD